MLNKTSTGCRLIITAAAMLFLCAAGCSKPGGEFAFKRGMDDNYRRIDGVPEFASNEKVEWVFAAGRMKDGQVRLGDVMSLGITLLKRETVWVDITTRAEKVSPEKNMIYGTISGLQAGQYKIQVFEVESRTAVREKEFIIYEKESEDEPDTLDEP